MKGYKTKLQEVDAEEVIKAHWNYKYDGTPEEIEKISKSIAKDGSAGVLAVRMIEVEGKPFFEVMDGNHRLEALKTVLGLKKIRVENFGVISDAEAVMVATRRNHQYFEDDKIKHAKLMHEVVLQEFSPEELTEFSHYSMGELETFKHFSEFNWETPEQNSPSDSGDGSGSGDKKQTIYLKVNQEVFNLWEKWLERAELITGLGNPERAFEFAVIEALNIPEEDLQNKES